MAGIAVTLAHLPGVAYTGFLCMFAALGLLLLATTRARSVSHSFWLHTCCLTAIYCSDMKHWAWGNWERTSLHVRARKVSHQYLARENSVHTWLGMSVQRKPCWIYSAPRLL